MAIEAVCAGAHRIYECTCTITDVVTEVFFRVVSCFYPHLGERMQNIFHRLHIVWLRITNAWADETIETLKQEKAALQSQNQALSVDCQQMKEDNNEIAQENTVLKTQTKAFQALFSQDGDNKSDLSSDPSDLYQEAKELDRSFQDEWSALIEEYHSNIEVKT